MNELTPANTLKQALAKGQVQIGLWLALADSYSAELCSASGFDWLAIDAEHAPNDLRSLLSTLQVLQPSPSVPVVRLPGGDSVLIKQVLDLGATNLIVPMVESATEAQALVDATRYPPTGIRGVGSGIARSSRWTRYSDYLERADNEICLILQVESVAALEEVNAIASVDGVDGVFIGPADLAASMGYRGHPAHPAVREAIEGAVAAIRSAGKAPGILCLDEELAHHYLSLGVQLVAVGVDTTLLVQATQSLAERFTDAKKTR